MSRFGWGGDQWFDDNGKPLSRGKLYFYEVGSSTPKATYSNSSLTTANTWPVVLDADGRQPDVFFGGAAKLVVQSAAGVQIDTSDPVYPVQSTVTVVVGDEAGVTVETWDDLMLIESDTDFSICTMLGFNEPGDGGGGVFYWDSTSVATADIGTIVQPTATVGAGRWLRVYSGPVSIKWFGAVGDGSTDDWAAYRNTLRFCSLNGKTMYIPEGTFFIGIGQGGMSILGSLRMIGDGYNSIILREEVQDENAAAVIAYTSSTRLDYIELEGVHFKGQYDSVQWSGTTACVGASNIDNVIIKDCYFSDIFSFATGFTNCESVVMTGNTISNTGRDGLRTTACTLVVVSNNTLSRTFDDAIAIHTNDSVTTELLLKTQIVITGNNLSECSRGIVALGGQDVNITGNTLVRCGLGGIVVIHKAAGAEGENTPYNINIANNVIVDMLPQVWSADNWVTYDWRSVITPADAVRAIEVSGPSSANPGVGTYEISSNGYPLQPYGLVSLLNCTAAANYATTGVVNIDGNTISRTIEFGGMFSDAGYGLPWAKNGTCPDLSYDSASGKVVGVALSGKFADVVLANNTFSGLYDGIAFTGTTNSGANGYCHSMSIKNNSFVDIQVAALANINDSDSLYMDFGSITIASNKFDLDPFYLGIEDQDQTVHVDTKFRRDNGSWNITGIQGLDYRVRACFITRGVVTGSVVMQHNSFKNLSVIIGENVDTTISQPATLIFGQNVLHIGIGSTDVALGNNNLGIAQRLLLGQWTVFAYYDADIASPDFGEYQTTVYSSSTVPASGYYTLGHVVVKANPTSGTYFYLVRATSGTNHVVGTDWLEIDAV